MRLHFTALVLAATSLVVVAQDIAPPTIEGCVPHQNHYDCAEDSFCELNGAGDGWECVLADGSTVDGNGAPLTGSNGDSNLPEHGSSSGGSTCIIHGGHTHGDCFGQCNSIDTGNYDMPLHVAAVFIIMIGSIAGVVIPLLTRNWARVGAVKELFFAARYFGTGVIIATALVHLLFHAFVMFNNSCLIDRLAFEPAAALISIGAIYLVFVVDLFSLRYIRSLRAKQIASQAQLTSNGSNIGAVKGVKDLHELPLSYGHAHGVENFEILDERQARLEVWLLEAGIIFHSIMIGVMLGATGGSPWIPLLCAIVFHQMFEGLALGSRIALLKFERGRGWQRWFMAACFALITPLGIAIGIGAHGSYNPNSDAALLSIGVLDAISAGILLYAGLVELLAHDFMEGDLKNASTSRVLLAIGWVFLGTGLMCFLGKWA